MRLRWEMSGGSIEGFCPMKKKSVMRKTNEHSKCKTPTMERSVFAGDTDFSGIPLRDIIEHFKRWKTDADDTINELKIRQSP